MIRRFIRQHASAVTGVLSGFDRVRFRGTLRRIANAAGLQTWMQHLGVRFASFKEFAEGLTSRLVEDAVRVAAEADRPVQYVQSASVNKEELAREIATRDGIEEGLVCVLACVEPCLSFNIRRHPRTGLPTFMCETRKCKHLYHYWIHPELGWLHVRLQTWLPFTTWVCINGREWLAQQMTAEGLGYQRRGNCFIALEDPEAAQRLMDLQLKTSWPKLLTSLMTMSNPGHAHVFASYPLAHYWSADETEWATDVMFRSAKDLAALYPKLTNHAITAFSSADVMRFLGRRCGEHVRGNFNGQIVSDWRHRPEGLRVKHRVNHNSIKMYDKEGSVLRVETTINQAREFPIYRPPPGNPQGQKRWGRMRKGVADLKRRATVSQRANERYLDALAACNTERTVGETVQPICRSVTTRGRRVRAMNPMSVDDHRLLQAVASGEFMVNGFRNRDIRCLLFGPDPQDPAEQKRRSAAISRKFQLLRAHGLIRRINRTHRYQLTAEGRRVISVLLLAQAAQSQQLAPAA